MMTTTTVSTMPRYSCGQGNQGLISRSLPSSSFSEGQFAKERAISLGGGNHGTWQEGTGVEQSLRQPGSFSFLLKEPQAAIWSQQNSRSKIQDPDPRSLFFSRKATHSGRGLVRRWIGRREIKILRERVDSRVL